ncbi:hypothetical protein D4R86_00235 [bacterium]|nr:MAG: hypothetical protein D4R86_00235 [bacterium]
MDYQRFRVRTPVRTFRDLEVYQESTKLAAQIFNFKIPRKYKEGVLEEVQNLKQMAKVVPKLIVESYNDKFNDFKVADKKLEIAAQTINLIITKLDFLSAFIEDAEFRNLLSDILKKYQRNKFKIINLKKAWGRVFKK